MDIRKKMCSRCSCLSMMSNIYKYRDKVPENEFERMEVEEILSYRDLWWELFQCYIDWNWVKCKWLYEYVKFLKSNPEIEKKIESNLRKSYNRSRWI